MSPILAQNVEFIEWLPNSNHAVIAQTVGFKTWAEIKKYLNQEEVNEIINESKIIMDNLISTKTSYDEFDKCFSQLKYSFS